MDSHLLSRGPSEINLPAGLNLSQRMWKNWEISQTSGQEAIPHVSGLQILNDCEENQKLTHKLPDWLASHWNRQVTQTLNDKTEYPSFQDFTDFMSTEADIACNPITSYHALHSSNILTEKRNQRDMKGTKPVCLTLKQWHRVKVQNWLNKVQDLNVFFVRAITISSITALSSGQSLWRNEDDMSKNRLCYGCMKIGHNAKDCPSSPFLRNLQKKASDLSPWWKLLRNISPSSTFLKRL